jgi:hypothetical protein
MRNAENYFAATLALYYMKMMMIKYFTHLDFWQLISNIKTQILME